MYNLLSTFQMLFLSKQKQAKAEGTYNCSNLGYGIVMCQSENDGCHQEYQSCAQSNKEILHTHEQRETDNRVRLLKNKCVLLFNF